MEKNLQVVRELLLRGDSKGAWLQLAPALIGQPEDVIDELVEAITYDVADADPVVLEQFFGRVFLATGQTQRGEEALVRAQRWKAAQERSERELGLDFTDPASLYRFLGANDFREYAEEHNAERGAGERLLLDERTVSWHFQAQQMEKFLPVLRHFPGASWLTVGDGRHAFEARFLMKYGARAFPTNLDPTLLKEAKELRLIDEYGVEDVQQLSFPDKSFDFVCSKDSLHHCLDPWRGLHEMMRVARKGIIFIEPFDRCFGSSAIYDAHSEWHSFEEEPGNYVYSFSEREMEKLGVSLGWRCLAARGMGIHHPTSPESTDPEDIRRQRAGMDASEGLARQRQTPYTNLGVVLLREIPTPDLTRDLEAADFAVTILPLNPHLRRAVLQSLDVLYNRDEADQA